MNMHQALKFVDNCAKLGVTAPASIAQGHAVIARAEAYKDAVPDVHVLDLTTDELHEYITDISVRSHKSTGINGAGMEYGLDAVKTQVSQEVRAAALPQLDALVEELRPQFDEHATAITIAVKQYGFTAATTAEQVIKQLTVIDAISAWKNAQEAVRPINTIARLMEQMVTLFDLRPSETDYKGRRPGPPPVVNYSVLFALADNWGLGDEYTSSGGDHRHGNPYVLDWYALAPGGLRLNTPSEVIVKLNGRNATEQLALRASQAETTAP
ncbi:hypothetical protein [Clavibacter michiganensis]|uniref:hypothetical protein n=1 Tax=Clavibacter michiganensis TaxID=28447 RepID=UPI0011AFF059|nr:hypothetical protein [Clavibacter michiganensis]